MILTLINFYNLPLPIAMNIINSIYGLMTNAAKVILKYK